MCRVRPGVLLIQEFRFFALQLDITPNQSEQAAPVPLAAGMICCRRSRAVWWKRRHIQKQGVVLAVRVVLLVSAALWGDAELPTV